MHNQFCKKTPYIDSLIHAGADLSGIKIIEYIPDSLVSDYQIAMKLADKEALKQLHETIFLSWYDHDRDFESPQYLSKCHKDNAIPSFMDYGISHGANSLLIFKMSGLFFSTCQ